MKYKPKLLCTLVFVVLWAITCLTASFCYDRFGGALGDVRGYLWFYGPVLLLAVFLRGGEEKPQETQRWAQVLVFYLCTALVYFLFLLGIDPLYTVWTWTIVLMLIFAFIGSRLHLRAPKGCSAICSGILFYGCYLLALLAFLLIFRPLTVQQVCARVDGQGLDFLHWESSYNGKAPLGTYLFCDNDDNFYYYDVISGDCIEKQNIYARIDDVFSDTVTP